MFGFQVAKKPTFFSPCVLAASWDTVEDDFQGVFYSEIWKAFHNIELFRKLIFNNRGVTWLLVEDVLVVNKF